jgi:hypothetical protein
MGEFIWAWPGAIGVSPARRHALSFGTNGYNQYGVPELPGGWTSPSANSLNLSTTYQVDDLGRIIEQTSPSGDQTFYIYDDANHAVFTFTGATATLNNAGTGTLTGTTGPVTMTRTRVPYSYTAGGNTYEGTYSETMTLSINTPISYTGGGGRLARHACVSRLRRGGPLARLAQSHRFGHRLQPAIFDPNPFPHPV